MLIQAEIDENGVIKVRDPKWRGKKITLSEWNQMEPEGKTNWDAIWKIFQKADALDIPRRSPDEILRDLREFRESGS